MRRHGPEAGVSPPLLSGREWPAVLQTVRQLRVGSGANRLRARRSGSVYRRLLKHEQRVQLLPRCHIFPMVPRVPKLEQARALSDVARPRTRGRQDREHSQARAWQQPGGTDYGRCDGVCLCRRRAGDWSHLMRRNRGRNDRSDCDQQPEVHRLGCVHRHPVGVVSADHAQGARVHRPHCMQRHSVHHGDCRHAPRPRVPRPHNLFTHAVGKKGGGHASQPRVQRPHDVHFYTVGN